MKKKKKTTDITEWEDSIEQSIAEELISLSLSKMSAVSLKLAAAENWVQWIRHLLNFFFPGHLPDLSYLFVLQFLRSYNCWRK